MTMVKERFQSPYTKDMEQSHGCKIDLPRVFKDSAWQYLRIDLGASYQFCQKEELICVLLCVQPESLEENVINWSCPYHKVIAWPCFRFHFHQFAKSDSPILSGGSYVSQAETLKPWQYTMSYTHPLGVTIDSTSQNGCSNPSVTVCGTMTNKWRNCSLAHILW